MKRNKPIEHKRRLKSGKVIIACRGNRRMIRKRFPSRFHTLSGDLDFRKISPNSQLIKKLKPSPRDIHPDAEDYIMVEGNKKGPVTFGDIEKGRAVNRFDIPVGMTIKKKKIRKREKPNKYAIANNTINNLMRRNKEIARSNIGIGFKKIEIGRNNEKIREQELILKKNEEE